MKKIICLAMVILLISCQKPSQLSPLQLKQSPNKEEFLHAFSKINALLEKEQHTECLPYFKVIEQFSARDPELTMHYIRSLINTNQPEEATLLLNTILKTESQSIHKMLSQTMKTDFEKLDTYAELIEQSKAFLRPVNTSSIAFKLDEKNLIPEGVAYDNKTKKVFISSIYKRKIKVIDKNGKTSDFIPSGFEDIKGVIGMEVDEKRNELWVCSGVTNQVENFQNLEKQAGIYCFDISTSTLKKKYLLKDENNRLLNDLTVHSDGTVYITESLQGQVFRIRPESDSLELFIDSDHYYFANGICLSEDEKQLFVAHFSGIDCIHLTSGKVSRIKHSDSITLGRIDGLAFYKNTLIAHQPSLLNGVYQYKLNNHRDSIVSKQILERNHPEFDVPTTGEIAGKEYYYIANAQLGKFKDNSILPIDQLKEVIIMKCTLEE